MQTPAANSASINDRPRIMVGKYNKHEIKSKEKPIFSSTVNHEIEICNMTLRNTTRIITQRKCRTSLTFTSVLVQQHTKKIYTFGKTVPAVTAGVGIGENERTFIINQRRS